MFGQLATTNRSGVVTPLPVSVPWEANWVLLKLLRPCQKAGTELPLKSCSVVTGPTPGMKYGAPSLPASIVSTMSRRPTVWGTASVFRRSYVIWAVSGLAVLGPLTMDSVWLAEMPGPTCQLLEFCVARVLGGGLVTAASVP